MKQSENRLTKRILALMPGGIPRWVRIYDDGECGDRYTVVYTGAAVAKRCGAHPYRCMSAAPYHPQGVCQWGHEGLQAVDTILASTAPRRNGYQWPPAIGRRNWLGLRIRFQDLPEDCRNVVIDDYAQLWELKPRFESERRRADK